MNENTQQIPTPEDMTPPPALWAPPPHGSPYTGQDTDPKKKMGKGKKAGLWTGGILVAFIAMGALTNDPKTAPTAGTVANSSTAAPAPSVAAPADKAAGDKAAADKAAADNAAADKAAADKAAADKAAADKAAADKAAADKAAADKKAEDAKKAAAAKAAAAKAAAEKAANAVTVSQEQAIAKAESYLEFTAFSRKGLIEQLQYEQFSKSDATFAVDHITVNWNEQAAKKAQSYLDMTSFSRGGLIDQLRFEGFSKSQAAYGVKAVGL
ncbi:hypothetical protein GCM10027039_26440 [Terrabacter koreensis]